MIAVGIRMEPNAARPLGACGDGSHIRDKLGRRRRQRHHAVAAASRANPACLDSGRAGVAGTVGISVAAQPGQVARVTWEWSAQRERERERAQMPWTFLRLATEEREQRSKHFASLVCSLRARIFAALTNPHKRAHGATGWLGLTARTHVRVRPRFQFHPRANTLGLGSFRSSTSIACELVYVTLDLWLFRVPMDGGGCWSE